MSKTIKHWTFPVPSTSIYSGVQLLYPGANAILLFDYYNENNTDTVIYNSSIKFEMVRAFKHHSEGFKVINEAYDNLIEIMDSEWVNQLKTINRHWNMHKLYKLRHFAIYLDSNGLFEFVANDFKVCKKNVGKLEEIDDEF